MIVGPCLQMRFGNQKKRQETMQKEISLKRVLSGKLSHMIKNILITYDKKK